MYANDFVAIEKTDTFDVLQHIESKINNKETMKAYKEYLVRNKWTTDTIVKEFKKIHGNKYDYSKVKYVGSDEKVTIICPIHGEFEQTPNMHLQGNGCPICGGSIKSTTPEFIKKAKKIHGDKYDYSKVKYINSTTKVTIICKEHGEFEQTPKCHLNGRSCPFCHGRGKTTKSIIKEFKKVHGNKYDYSKVKYVDWKTKVIIICKEHGEFEQNPNNHLYGKGCSKCAGVMKSSTPEFIKKAKKVHGNKYDYSKFKYVDWKTKGIIICPIHGKFEQTPNGHLNGRGCPQCGIESRRK
jgi:hypothetical protein